MSRVLARVAIYSLLVLLLTATLFYEDIPLQGIGSQESAGPELVEFYIEGGQSDIFNVDGALEYSVRHKAAQRMQNDSVLRIDAPQLDAYNKGKISDTVVARHGELKNKGALVTLIGDVVLERQDSEDRFLTEEITLLPDRKIARTDAVVRFENKHANMTGKGLRLHMERGEARLLADVQGVYEYTNSQ